MKAGTIKKVEERDAQGALFSADDEDTILLTISWHEDGYRKLYDQGQEIFNKIESKKSVK